MRGSGGLGTHPLRKIQLSWACRNKSSQCFFFTFFLRVASRTMQVRTFAANWKGEGGGMNKSHDVLVLLVSSFKVNEEIFVFY